MHKPVGARVRLQYLLKSAMERVDAKRQTGTIAECEEVKRLHESRVVSVPTEFNEPDFDRPIILASLTMAHVTDSGTFVCSPGVKNYSIF